MYVYVCMYIYFSMYIASPSYDDGDSKVFCCDNLTNTSSLFLPVCKFVTVNGFDCGTLRGIMTTERGSAFRSAVCAHREKKNEV